MENLTEIILVADLFNRDILFFFAKENNSGELVLSIWLHQLSCKNIQVFPFFLLPQYEIPVLPF